MPPENPATHAALTRAAEHAFAWLDGLDSRSVATTATLEEMRARLGRPLADRGVPATQVIDDLVADVDGGILGSQSGRFFGWVIGGGGPAAMAADWLKARMSGRAIEKPGGTKWLAAGSGPSDPQVRGKRTWFED